MDKGSNDYESSITAEHSHIFEGFSDCEFERKSTELQIYVDSKAWQVLLNIGLIPLCVIVLAFLLNVFAALLRYF